MVHNINNSHPLVCLADKVRGLCQEFFTAMDLSYLHYRRVYGDKTAISLLTHPECFLDTLDMAPQPLTGYGAVSKKDTVTLWQEAVPPLFISFTKEKHQLFQGIILRRWGRDYCDIFSFALSEERRDAANFYLNILNNLNLFADHFLERGKDLIDIARRQPIIFPKAPEKTESTKWAAHHTNTLMLQGRQGLIPITHRCFHKLLLIQKGKSYEEIGILQSLPKRHVENAVRDLQQRLGYPLYQLTPALLHSLIISDTEPNTCQRL